jgi:uncharacterized protein YciI
MQVFYVRLFKSKLNNQLKDIIPMKKFILTYYGEPQFKTAEEAKKHQMAWMEWAKSLGDKIVEMGNPAKPGKNVSSKKIINADDENRFSGYSVVQAIDLDEAVALTKRCPFVIDGGTMGVHELVQMGA